MVHSESYKGIQITITTNSSGTNTWAARAEFAVPGLAAAVENADGTYASEPDAAAAALRAAVDAIDRSRIGIGKW